MKCGQMSVSIGKVVYSNYRLTQLLSSKTDATKLRGWDRFKELTRIGDKGEPKKKQLEQLYKELHTDIIKDSSNNQTTMININRLIVFNKMEKLVNLDENITPIHFSVHLESASQMFNTPSKVVFKVGNNVILQKKCSALESRVITSLKQNNLIGNDGVLSNFLTSDVIQQKQQKQQKEGQSAAIKIQHAYKNHVSIRLFEASDKIKQLCLTYGAKIITIDDIKIGDIIVVNRAKNSPKKEDWQKHGYIAEVISIYKEKGLGTNILDLNGDDMPQEIIFKKMGDMKFRKIPKFLQFNDKLKHLINEGSCYQLNKSYFSFSKLEASFIEVADTLKARSYSRQYNCNNVIHDTLRKSLVTGVKTVV